MTFAQSSPIGDTDYPTPPALSSVTLTACDEGSLDTQLTLASAIFDARGRSQLPHTAGDMAMRMVHAAAPTYFNTGTVELSEDD